MLFACSGDGAGPYIVRSEFLGYCHAGIVAILLMASAMLSFRGTRTPFVPALLAILLLIHPAWTIDATSGDCGMLKRIVSYAFTGIGVAALLCQGRILLRIFGQTPTKSTKS